MRSSHSSHKSHTSMSHRNSMSHHSHTSHHSSLSHRSRSSLSSMSRHRSSIRSMSNHNIMNKHHGNSDAHAFAVGKATGVNINGSAMGAHGAALGRFRRIRRNSSNMHHTFTRNNFNKRRIRFNKNKSNHKYTMNSSFSNFEEFANSMDTSKIAPIFIAIFGIALLMILGVSIMFMLSVFRIFNF